MLSCGTAKENILSRYSDCNIVEENKYGQPRNTRKNLFTKLFVVKRSIKNIFWFFVTQYNMLIKINTLYLRSCALAELSWRVVIQHHTPKLFPLFLYKIDNYALKARNIGHTEPTILLILHYIFLQHTKKMDACFAEESSRQDSPK